VLHAAVPGGLKIATKTVPLSEVEKHWADVDDRARTVFTTSS
jgi:hypothetical protein